MDIDLRRLIPLRHFMEMYVSSKTLKHCLCKAADIETDLSQCWFLWFTGTFHRRNGFYTVHTVCAIALHLPYT